MSSKANLSSPKLPGVREHYVNNNAEAGRKWNILCGFRREKDGFKRPKVGKKYKQKNLAAAMG
ncbi:hypothetical protein [Clostridium sp.]|uniref:hypothetical protein n=1 Tax=Clostridium sp. TaxID=1506 RepID=UPI003FD8575F